jgi:apolipoprotein N-acyltransferase
VPRHLGIWFLSLTVIYLAHLLVDVMAKKEHGDSNITLHVLLHSAAVCEFTSDIGLQASALSKTNRLSSSFT